MAPLAIPGQGWAALATSLITLGAKISALSNVVPLPPQPRLGIEITAPWHGPLTRDQFWLPGPEGNGVAVGPLVGVFVGVAVRVAVALDVGVLVGVLLGVGVFVGVGELPAVGVLLGVGVFVGVGVAVPKAMVTDSTTGLLLLLLLLSPRRYCR